MVRWPQLMTVWTKSALQCFRTFPKKERLKGSGAAGTEVPERR
jgi:hypothetical protein